MVTSCTRLAQYIYVLRYTFLHVIVLVNMKLLHISVDAGAIKLRARINKSRFRVFDKFVKKVIFHNPIYDSDLRIGWDQPPSTLDASSVPQRIRVLQLDACEEVEKANFRGLRNLRSLSSDG